MKKTKLVVEYDFDFVLVGITTSLKAYKLAWELRLLANKLQDADGRFLLAPEYPHFDYLLVVQDAEQSFAENILEAVRQIPSVELAAFIPLETLKTKENFIF